PYAGRVGDKKPGRAEGSRGGFEENLNREQSQRMEERIAALLEDIDQQGKKLTGSMSLKELLAYKAKVKAFMEEVLSGMLKYAKSSTMDRRGRHRIYTLVKRINKELEQLTEEMLGEQKNRLKILEKVDNIRGLLVDLYT
ncbi:MAG: YaaR family protein, partial [Clostridiales bacterium]|nr:YaaR family protein [Clostridiales bacterium]